MALTPLRLLDFAMSSGRLSKIHVKDDPVIIIGHPCSGTTYLHNMVAAFTGRGFPTSFQVFFPGLELFKTEIFKSVYNKMVPERRQHDFAMRTADSPEEEEFALSALSLMGGIHCMFFPHDCEIFKKWVLHENLSEPEFQKWKNLLMDFFRRVVALSGTDNLVLKNPYYLGRIPNLLRIFPKAKFIFIHRNPYQVYVSSLNMYQKSIREKILQPCTESQYKDKIIMDYRLLTKKYLMDKVLIPECQLIEVGYDEALLDPMEIAGWISRKLDLSIDNWGLKKFIMEQKNHRFNALKLEVNDVQLVSSEWDFAFREWNYPTEPLSNLISA
jgi:hypothetical protein